MSMFKAIIGDLFASDAQTLVNTVNCVGVMGKGIALKFKEQFPEMFRDYAERCERGSVRLGEPYVFDDKSGRKIINFPTKGHWRSTSRMSDVENGLDYLARHTKTWGITSIAIPPLGCGNGGLEWSEVGPLIFRKLSPLQIDVEVYAPYGTPGSELTTSYLAMPSQMALSGKGRRHGKMEPGLAAVVQVLKELEDQPYAPSVGRTIFQKICYVLTELGVPTGFDFSKGSYGPFSTDVKLALHSLANQNWVEEAPLGRMVQLRVGDQFSREQARYRQEIENYRKQINKTVDLFSRIKNTEQAEEVLTVLFACRQIKRGDRATTIDEQQVLNYILDWKAAWNTPEKTHAVASAVRNLALLGWIRVAPSASMLDFE